MDSSGKAVACGFIETYIGRVKGGVQVHSESEEIGLPEAAQLLECSWAIAWNAMLAGKLQGRKAGRTYLVTRASVERLRMERSGQRNVAGRPAHVG
jgi:hypothetical protein